jgi:hypothetical protein
MAKREKRKREIQILFGQYEKGKEPVCRLLSSFYLLA